MRRLLQAMIDDSYDQFVAVVSTGRNIPADTLRADIADGRIFTGRQAPAWLLRAVARREDAMIIDPEALLG